MHMLWCKVHARCYSLVVAFEKQVSCTPVVSSPLIFGSLFGRSTGKAFCTLYTLCPMPQKHVIQRVIIMPLCPRQFFLSSDLADFRLRLSNFNQFLYHLCDFWIQFTLIDEFPHIELPESLRMPFASTCPNSAGKKENIGESVPLKFPTC